MGLTLMIVAFALGWIPYVSYIGGLIALVGLILLFLGRWGYDDRHHNFVLAGIVLLILVLVASFVVVLGFAAAVVGDAQSTTSLSGLTSTVQGQIDALLVATAVLGAFSGVAHVLIPYGLADRTTRYLLWTAFLLQVAVSIIVLALLLPMVNSAVSQSLSGSTFNAGPIGDLQTSSALIGMLSVGPSALFALGYYRVRSTAIVRE
jgi:hypothetical protein